MKTKVCTKCHVDQPIENYHKSGQRGRLAYCKTCRAKQRKTWSNGRVGREAARRAHLQARYKLSLDEVSAVLIAQDSKCLICQELLEKYHIDHCHDTGRIRGILCGKCNMGLGLFKDSPELLSRAVKYLGA